MLLSDCLSVLQQSYICGALRYTDIIISAQKVVALGTLNTSSLLVIGGEARERFREKRVQALILVEMGTHQ